MDKFLKSLQQQLDAEVAPHVHSNFEEIARRVPTDISTARKPRVTPLKAFSAAAVVAISAVVLAAGSSAPTPRTDFDTPLQVRWNDFWPTDPVAEMPATLDEFLAQRDKTQSAAVNCFVSPSQWGELVTVMLQGEISPELIKQECYNATVNNPNLTYKRSAIYGSGSSAPATNSEERVGLPEPEEFVICVAEWDRNLYVFPVGPNTVSADHVCQQNATHPASFDKSSEMRPVMSFENPEVALWWLHRVAPNSISNYEGYPTLTVAWDSLLKIQAPAPEVVREILLGLVD